MPLPSPDPIQLRASREVTKDKGKSLTDLRDQEHSDSENLTVIELFPWKTSEGFEEER